MLSLHVTMSLKAPFDYIDHRASLVEMNEWQPEDVRWQTCVVKLSTLWFRVLNVSLLCQ